MEQHDYFKLYNNLQIIKIKRQGSVYLFYEPSNLVVCLTFFHTGISDDENRRVSITTTSKEEFLSSNSLINVSARCTIMANADDPLYALTYSLVIQSTDKTILLKLKKHPHLGQNLITHEELNGLVVNIN